jgi:hypothetical protein
LKTQKALRLVDDVIELDGQPVARLLPKPGATLVYRLIEAFDYIDNAEDAIEELEATIAMHERRFAMLGGQLRGRAISQRPKGQS